MKRRPMQILRAALLSLALPGLTLPALPQSNQPTLETQLIGKPLYLRGLWASDDLRFDGTGHLLSPSQTTAFTLSGIDVQKVRLEGSRLLLEGRRVGLELEQQDARTRVPLQTTTEPGSDEPVHIEIGLAPGQDYTKAIGAILTDLSGLVSALPPFWQNYATNNFLAPGDGQPLHSKKVAKDLRKPVDKGKENIVRPTLLTSTRPTYPQAAQNLGYKGTVIVSLVVGKEGNPEHLQVLRPAGLGLDEEAIAAVRHYTFTPATQKGKRVPVDLNIAIDFGGGAPQIQ